jgi:hypothetical protein
MAVGLNDANMVLVICFNIIFQGFIFLIMLELIIICHLAFITSVLSSYFIFPGLSFNYLNVPRLYCIIILLSLSNGLSFILF